MTTCLTKSEIDTHSLRIRQEFQQLFTRRVFAQRPDKKQWDFFRHCFEVLLGAGLGDFPCDGKRAKEYKFEISRNLLRYYSMTHENPIHFTFRLESARYKHEFMNAEADYPSSNKYLLLVFPTVPKTITRQELRNILSRVVDGAVHAEFSAYMGLPNKDLHPLEDYFDAEGPAYQRIQETVEKHMRNGEVLSNDGNPSAKLLKSIRVIRADEEMAEVQTREFWHLQWWSPERKAYASRSYEGTNLQRYILRKRGSRWMVWENQYRRPKRPRS